MEDVKSKKNLSEESWFWKLTTKWYFFPLFYLSIVLLINIISYGMRYGSFDFNQILSTVISMPVGLMIILFPLYLILPPTIVESFSVIIFFLLIFAVGIKVCYEKRISISTKALIVFLFSLIVIIFVFSLFGLSIGRALGG